MRFGDIQDTRKTVREENGERKEFSFAVTLQAGYQRLALMFGAIVPVDVY